MYSNYNGGLGLRSRSTADISRTRFGPGNASASVPIGYATVSRASARRRPVPPTPPCRMYPGSPDLQIKRAKSYLTEEMRRDFEVAAHQLSASAPTRESPLQLLRQKRERELQLQQQQQSPGPTYGGNNFVKRLVATLERKQGKAVPQEPTIDMKHVTIRQQHQNDYEYISPPIPLINAESPKIPVPPPMRIQKNRFSQEEKRIGHGPTRNFAPNYRLTIMHEHEDEDAAEGYSTEDICTSEDDEDSTHSSRDSPLWSQRHHQQSFPKFNPSPVPSSPSPQLRDAGYHNNTGTKVGGAKRVLKNVIISALKSWRSFKSNKTNQTIIPPSPASNDNLPQGNRDYYSTRPSLGEEMRTFRSEMMPQMYESAVSRNRDWDRPIPEERELTLNQLFPEDKVVPMPERKNTIATIRPIYGSVYNHVNKHPDLSCGSAPPTLKAPEVSPLPTQTENHYMCMTGNRKFIQPPALPPVLSIPRMTMDHLRSTDTNQRSFRSCESCSSSVCSSSSTSSSLQMRSKDSSSSTENFYDVPRNVRPILPRQPPALVNYETIQVSNKRYSQPDYDNYTQTFLNERALQTFTTF